MVDRKAKLSIIYLEGSDNMNMQNDVRVTVRVDRNLKDRADKLFERLGMNMTTAFNVFLRKSVDENAIPFPVSAKPVKYSMGYTADEITHVCSEAVEEEVASHLAHDGPIAKYDVSKNQAYLENSDGTREYI